MHDKENLYINAKLKKPETKQILKIDNQWRGEKKILVNKKNVRRKKVMGDFKEYDRRITGYLLFSIA